MSKLVKSTFIGFIVCAAACLSLPITANAQNISPLVRIGKTATAPIIDGNLDDTAWKNSVVVGDFSVIGGKTPASESTRVRFVYDAQNLYVSWRVEESLLVIARQEMHRVKTDAKKLDDNVLSDDSVVLFVQPGKNAKVREFNINSIGTLFDAESDRGKLWETRNAAWNSDAKVAAVQEDGYWATEIAIPWKAFDLQNAPVIDTAWNIGLAHNAVGRKEISSWTSTGSSGIHSMESFGALIFDNNVPSIDNAALAPFEANKSTFAAQISAPVQLNVNLTEDKKTQKFDAQGSGKLSVPLTATAPKVLFSWDAKDGQKYFYRSPVLEISAENTQAHLKISTEKPWKLYLNGALSQQGNAAQNQDVALPLADGINDIVVEAQSGQAQLRLISPLPTSDEKTAWRTHDTSDPKVLFETDRRAWAIAPESNGVIGTAGNPAYLQHTLLHKNTLSYPVGSPAFYIAQNTAQQITFLTEGIKGIRLENWQMTIAAPPELEILGSSGYYGNTIKGKVKFDTTKIGTTTIDGKKLTLYRVAATAPIDFGKYSQTVLTSFELVMRLPQSAPISKNWQGDLYYWANANGNAVSETPQRIALRALPPLNGKQPKKFAWELWTSQARLPQYDNAEVLPSILQTAKDAGFNKYFSASQKEFNDEVREHSMKPITGIYFSDSRLSAIIKPYLKEHPDERLIDKSGKPSDVYMDTTLVLGKNWSMYEKWIKDFVVSSGVDEVDYDYEYPPFNPPHASFAPQSLEEFRKFAKIDASVELSPPIIEKIYKNQWIDFMAYRTAVLLKKMKDAVHEANPKVLFSSYSGYYNAKNDTTKARYGIDWNLVGEMQSVDEAGMGYGRPVPGIQESVEALRGIPVKFGELLTPYDVHSRRPVSQLLKANLLRRALDSTTGVLVYTRNSMDGRSWQAVAEISRLTADYEDAFLHKTLKDVPNQNSANVQIIEGGGKVLLCVMNTSGSKESTFDIEIPPNLGAGKEYYSGQNVHGGEKIRLELEPGDVRVFVF